jgi:hypothetical protein
MLMGVGSVLAFLVGYFWWGKARWGLRGALCTLIGGLLAYSILNLGFEGPKYWLSQSGQAFVVEITIVGLLFGWIGAFIWWLSVDGRYPNKR